MAHFAELDSNNIVLRVLCLDNSVIENEQGQRVEQIGIDFLKNLYGKDTIWKQTSYNTKGGVYYNPNTNEPDLDQSKAFRKNYPSANWTYDSTRDAFIPAKPPIQLPDGDDWELDEFLCLWFDPKAPKEYPRIGVSRVE